MIVATNCNDGPSENPISAFFLGTPKKQHQVETNSHSFKADFSISMPTCRGIPIAMFDYHRVAAAAVVEWSQPMMEQ